MTLSLCHYETGGGRVLGPVYCGLMKNDLVGGSSGNIYFYCKTIYFAITTHK